MSEANNSDKDYRTYQYLIKKGNPLRDHFLGMMKCSNNLYNATNFHIRQVYSALTHDEAKPLHPLQQEVLDGLTHAIPVINKHLKEKYERLVADDKEKLEAAKKKDPVAKLKERKLNQFSMPTKEKSFLSYNLLDAYFKHTENIDYNSLPGQVNQQTMKNCYQNWKSYFESLKDYKVAPGKYTGKPKPPKYKPSGSYSGLTFSNQICKINTDKSSGKKYLKFPLTDLTFNLSKHILELSELPTYKLAVVRVQKWFDDVRLEIVLDCTQQIVPLIDEDKIENVMSIDLGVNNLAACVSNNGMQPFIINGRSLKSINQFYNKKRAEMMADLRRGKKQNEGVHTSKRLLALDRKRSLKVRDYMHKATHLIVQEAIKNYIHKVIIGYNATWKEDVALRKKDKQTFIQIPFTLFIGMLKYKLNALGIHVETHEESYTSQASFIDKDEIPTYGETFKVKPTFKGKRTKRGLYRTQKGITINADINGAANILRKHWHKPVEISHKLLSQVAKIHIKHATKPSVKKKFKKKETVRNKPEPNKKLATPRKGIASRTTKCVVGQINLWELFKETHIGLKG